MGYIDEIHGAPYIYPMDHQYTPNVSIYIYIIIYTYIYIYHAWILWGICSLIYKALSLSSYTPWKRKARNENLEVSTGNGTSWRHLWQFFQPDLLETYMIIACHGQHLQDEKITWWCSVRWASCFITRITRPYDRSVLNGAYKTTHIKGSPPCRSCSSAAKMRFRAFAKVPQHLRTEQSQWLPRTTQFSTGKNNNITSTKSANTCKLQHAYALSTSSSRS